MNVTPGQGGRCIHSLLDCQTCVPPTAEDRAVRDLLVRGLRPGTMRALDRIANEAGLSRQEYLRRLLVAAAGG